MKIKTTKRIMRRHKKLVTSLKSSTANAYKIRYFIKRGFETLYNIFTIHVSDKKNDTILGSN